MTSTYSVARSYPAINLALFGRRTLRDKAEQWRLPLLWGGLVQMPSLAFRNLVFVLLAIGFAGSACAGRCVLPVPDGDKIEPSPPNVEGKIRSVDLSLVSVENAKTKMLVSIRIPRGASVYTSFGGDGAVSDLRPGQWAAVWFVGCHASATKEQMSAYFQIFSKDPNDQP